MNREPKFGLDGASGASTRSYPPAPNTSTSVIALLSLENSTEKRFLRINEFSVRYGRSRSRTYELIKSGALPAVKDGRSTLIPVDGAEAWARNLSRLSDREPVRGDEAVGWLKQADTAAAGDAGVEPAASGSDEQKTD